MSDPSSRPAGSSNSRAPGRNDLFLRILAASLAGVAMFLGSPDIDLWWLGFVGWVPWIWAIDGQSPKRAFWLGSITGTIAVFGGFFWLGELLERFAGFPLAVAIPVQLLFSAFQGLQWALPAWLLARLGQSGRPLRWLVPLSWALVEWSWPNVFPTYMSLIWCWQPEWIQHADIGGSWLVSATMVAINAALYDLIVALTRRLPPKPASSPTTQNPAKSVGLEPGQTEYSQIEPGQTEYSQLAPSDPSPSGSRWLNDPRIRAALALGLWLFAIRGYGALRIAQVSAQSEARPKLKFGVVQGNFGIVTYAQPFNRDPILRALQQQSAKLEAEGAEVILWGESAYPYARTLHRDSTQDLPAYDPRRLQGPGMSAPLIAGLVTFDATKDDPYPWNTAWVLQKDGQLGDRYDKTYPLMFGEWVPLVDPEWYLRQIPSASYIHPGQGPGLLEVAGYRMGPLICYEDLLPDFVADTTMQGVHVLVNLTNDSWFGKTKEQSQHLGLALFRAIETRRPLLRSVNAGISAYIDPSGRVQQELPVTDSDTDGYRGADGFVAEVPMMDPASTTIFVWIQSRMPWLFFGLNALALWLAAGRPKSRALLTRSTPAKDPP